MTLTNSMGLGMALPASMSAGQDAGMWQGGGGGYGGSAAGQTGLQHNSGGNFLHGLGNYLGFGQPNQIGLVDAPMPGRDDYLLGGSAAASQGAYDAAGQRAAGYNNRAFGLNTGQAQSGLDGAFGLRGAENQTTNMLMGAAMGQGPSASESEFMSRANEANRQAQGMAMSARGGQGLLGARNAAETAFSGSAAAANQAATIRANEMNNARGMLLQNLAQRNQAELGRAGMGLNIGQAQADTYMRGIGLNDAAAQAEYARQMQIMQANQQGLMGFNQQASGNWGTAAGINAQAAQANLQQQNAQDAKRGALMKSIFGGASKAFGGAAGGVVGAIGGLF